MSIYLLQFKKFFFVLYFLSCKYNIFIFATFSQQAVIPMLFLRPLTTNRPEWLLAETQLPTLVIVDFPRVYPDHFLFGVTTGCTPSLDIVSYPKLYPSHWLVWVTHGCTLVTDCGLLQDVLPSLDCGLPQGVSWSLVIVGYLKVYPSQWLPGVTPGCILVIVHCRLVQHLSQSLGIMGYPKVYPD